MLARSARSHDLEANLHCPLSRKVTSDSWTNLAWPTGLGSFFASAGAGRSSARRLKLQPLLKFGELPICGRDARSGDGASATAESMRQCTAVSSFAGLCAALGGIPWAQDPFRVVGATVVQMTKVLTKIDKRPGLCDLR